MEIKNLAEKKWKNHDYIHFNNGTYFLIVKLIAISRLKVFLLNHNTILIQLFKFCIPAIILEPFI